MRTKGTITVAMTLMILLLVGNACKKDSDSPVGPGGSYEQPATSTPTRQPGTGDIIGRVLPASLTGLVTAKQGALVAGVAALSSSSEYYRLYNLEPGTVFLEVDVADYGDLVTDCVVVAGEVSQVADVYPPTPTVTPNRKYAWVSDYGNNRLVRINGEGDTITAYDVYDGTLIDGTPFTQADSLSVDSVNNTIWLASRTAANSVVKVSTSSPNVSIGTIALDQGAAMVAVDDSLSEAWVSNWGSSDSIIQLNSGASGATTIASYNDTRGLAVDSQGDCWLATDGTGAVKVRRSDGALLGQYTFGGARAWDVAVDLRDDSCWMAILESVASIIKVDSNGNMLTTVIPPLVSYVYKVDVDQNDGTCWATGWANSEGVIWRLDADGSNLVTYTAATTGLKKPWDIAVDQSSGEVWVTDLGDAEGGDSTNDNVVKMNRAGDILSTLEPGIFTDPYAVDVQLAQ